MIPVDILAALKGDDSSRDIEVALSVRGSQARHPGSLPAQPRHALPQFRTGHCRCPLGSRGQFDNTAPH
jgi:hypothetical protein